MCQRMYLKVRLTMCIVQGDSLARGAKLLSIKITSIN